MPPPRHLAPLDPDHPANLPAFDTAAPRPSSRHQVRSSPHASRSTASHGVFGNAHRLVFPVIRLDWLALRLRSLGVKRCPRRIVPQLLRDRLTPLSLAEEASISFGQSQNKLENLLWLECDSVRSLAQQGSVTGTQQGQVIDLTLSGRVPGRSWASVVVGWASQVRR
jgi:hypothetical protein